MTDEQIIIDGVDVSGCENLMQGIVPFGCMEDRKTCSCMNNPNCLYKQLKRKEQLLKSVENHIKDLDLMVHNGEERENELEQKFKGVNMNIELLNKVSQQVHDCYIKYGKYKSRHEFLGVLIEEIEELKQEIFKKEPDFD